MQIKNIVIDQGNSSFKIGVFEGKELLKELGLRKRKDVLEFVLGYHPDYVLLSSVVRKNKKLYNRISEKIKIDRLTSKTHLPYKNNYSTPATLGTDRIAAAAGAADMFKNKNCLIIDAGTCIKYDFIDEENTYHGGAISPGINMRFKSLNEFTSKLPLVKNVKEAELIGNSTQAAIESGVVNGVVSEVNGIIERYKKSFKDLHVILCGGDSIFFESKLKGHIFAVANLVLIGLNRILLYNIDNFEGTK